MQYFLHIAQSQEHIAQHTELRSHIQTTFVLRGDNFGNHLVVDSNKKNG